MSNDKSALPTDEFLRKLKEQEDEAAQKAQNSKHENPLGEESIRLQAHMNDPDRMRLDHSYDIRQGRSRCRICGQPLSPTDRPQGTHFVPTDDGSRIPNGHPSDYSVTRAAGWPNGADKIAGILGEGVTRLMEGATDIELRAFFLRRGYANKAQEYTADCHEILEGERIYGLRLKSNGHADAKTNGGMTKS